MTTRELLQKTLYALEHTRYDSELNAVMNLIRAHLAKPDETAELLREMFDALDNYEYTDSTAGNAAIAKYKEVTK